MLGTLVNTGAIIVGSALGMILKGGIPEKYKDIIMKALGLSVLYIGLSGALKNMMSDTAEPILFIASLVIGSIIGQWIDIEGRLNKLGDFIQSKMKKGSNVSQGFVTASLLFCVGTMAILGSIDSGIKGDHTTLFVKSMLDGVMSIMFASTLGIGVMFSAVTVLVYQGLITVFSSFLEPYITVCMMQELSIVGGILISCLGLNILEIKQIKVGNMLPSILIPVIYCLIFNPNCR